MAPLFLRVCGFKDITQEAVNVLFCSAYVSFLVKTECLIFKVVVCCTLLRIYGSSANVILYSSGDLLCHNKSLENYNSRAEGLHVAIALSSMQDTRNSLISKKGQIL